MMIAESKVKVELKEKEKKNMEKLQKIKIVSVVTGEKKNSNRR